MNWLAIALLFSSAISIERVRIDPKSGHFIDAHGRALIFHGVNVVQKKPPWHPSLGAFDPKSSLVAEDMANLKKWGFNSVRLGVMWEGVEPTMGNYDKNYLTTMRQIVDELYKYGIYSIVDFHQDSLSAQWCGQGIPNWMIQMLEPFTDNCNGVVKRVGALIGECKSFASYNIPNDPETGYPSIEGGCLDRTFDEYSRTPELVSAWGHFYANSTIQRLFHKYWAQVAATFADAPGVLGYDLINEPLNGDFYAEFKRLIPGYLDEHVLQPLYQSLHDVIRDIDPNAIIMYEPPPFPATYPSNIPFAAGVHSVGFTEGPAKQDKSNQALSYHIYSCGFAVQDCDRNGDTVSTDCPICDRYAKVAVKTRDADVKRLGGGVFLTEFGACSGSEECIAEIRRVLDNADIAMHSWAYWQFKYYDDITTVSGPIEGFYNHDGSLQTGKVTALSRTYATAIAGTPRQMKFDSLTGAFRLRYDAEDPLKLLLPTEIFMNKELTYASGYSVHVLNGTYTDSWWANRLVVHSTAAGPVDIAIARKQPPSSGGEIHTDDRDCIQWSSTDAETAGFELSTNSNITWWKSIKVYGDGGDLLCDLSMQDDNHGPAGCDLKEDNKHELLFDYRVELWKAKLLGKHSHIYTISRSTLGPLLNKRIKLLWVDDKVKRANKLNSDIVV